MTNKQFCQFCFFVIGLLLLAGCSQEPAMTDAAQEQTEASQKQASTSQEATSSNPGADQQRQIPTQNASAAPSKITVPSGTEIHIRLDQSISTEENNSGDTFRAHLEQPIESGGEVVIPAGGHVVGELSEVKESGRVKGHARLTLRLKALESDGRTYPLSTHPITVEAEGTKKEDAKKVGIGAAVGAAIGAIAGGGDGAVKGAVIGGGAGTGVVLATKGEEVEFGPETQFIFTLSEPVEISSK